MKVSVRQDRPHYSFRSTWLVGLSDLHYIFYIYIYYSFCAVRRLYIRKFAVEGSYTVKHCTGSLVRMYLRRYYTAVSHA